MSYEQISLQQIDTLTSTTPNNGENILVTSSPVFGLKNKIINSNFDVWQRGTTSSNPATLSYGPADRWRNAWDGSAGTFTVSQQAFTLGQGIVPNEPTYFLRWNQTVANTGGTFVRVQQEIEDVRTLSGQTATISFWAKADASRTLNVSLAQNFGGGGSGTVTYATSSCALTTSWQKFARTVTLGNMGGKTLGTNHRLQLIFDLPINVIMTIDLSQIQLEAGNIDTPFEMIHISETQKMCYRYYEELLPNAIIASSWCGQSGANFSCVVNFTIKRVAPTRTDPSFSSSALGSGIFNTGQTIQSTSYWSTGNSATNASFQNSTNAKFDAEF